MLWRRLTIWLFCGSMMLPALAEAPSGFYVREANLDLVDGVYQLNAQFNLHFPKAAREALDSGVPLTIEVEIEVLRARWYWNDRIARLSQRYKLRFHALTRRYIVNNVNSGAQLTFTTLGDALASLSRLQGFPMLDQRLLPDQGRYLTRLRVSLDFRTLPLPLRTLAYVSPSWWLSSEWYEIPM